MDGIERRFPNPERWFPEFTIVAMHFTQSESNRGAAASGNKLGCEKPVGTVLRALKPNAAEPEAPQATITKRAG